MIHTRLIPPDILLTSAIDNKVLHGTYAPVNVTENPAPTVIIDKLTNSAFLRDSTVKSYYRIMMYDEYDEVCGGPLIIVVSRRLISDQVCWHFHQTEDIHDTQIGPFNNFRDAMSNIDVFLCDMINDHRVKYRVLNEMYEVHDKVISSSAIANTARGVLLDPNNDRKFIDYSSRLDRIKKK